MADIHSLANPASVRVTHLNLDLTVVFERQTIQGIAILTIDRLSRDATQLILDSRALHIDETAISADGVNYRESRFSIGQTDKILGAPIVIDIAPDTTFVRIRYSTDPAATALQWLAPAQTAGKKHPFLYTQSQAIHARSWIPLQDSPGVRVTFEARVQVPPGLKAVMGAADFVMNRPIPPYLIALAVGDLAFQPTGPRTGVWAEPSVVASASAEFSDMEKMLDAAERLYGPYRWGRYDVLVMPPSFPFGGMENPCLTFATPTVITGDKSLVSLVAHEMAHSWSGNLVTNATWSDFWLNEGYTVYIERRILEELYGFRRAEMEAARDIRIFRMRSRPIHRPNRFCISIWRAAIPMTAAQAFPMKRARFFCARLSRRWAGKELGCLAQKLFRSLRFPEHHHRPVARLHARASLCGGASTGGMGI